MPGAKIAAKEIGGKVAKNYGPTAVERKGAGRHHQQPRRPPRLRHRGRAERSRRRRAGDEAGAEARRQGHHLRRRFGVRRPAVLRQPGDQRFDRPLRGGNCSPRDGADPKGKVAIVSAQPTAANQNVWIEAFRDEIKKYPGVKIVDKVYGYDNEQKAFDATVALTTKYPDLAGIFAPTCPGLPAVARALESVDKGQGKIKLSGNCVPSITSKYMLDGTIEGSTSGTRSSSAT